MKKVIKGNIWDLINIEDLNNVLDTKLSDENVNYMATDIDYGFKKINDNGDYIIEADFTKAEF